MNPLNDPQALRLVPAPSSGERVAARFVSGDEPAAWLAEICAWDLGDAQVGLKLYVLPRSGTNRRPAGVLVVWPGDAPAPASVRAQAYRVLLGRFYLPVAAALAPPVSDEELARLCRPEDTSVFHPGAGLCAFRTVDALSLADLLTPPAVSAQDWAGAQPGLVPNVRLRSVRLETPTDLEGLFGEAAREIGVDAPRLEDLPTAPGEAATGTVADANRKLQEWLASLALGFTRFLPRTASVPTWVNRLENWANGQFARLTTDLSKMRHRELHRLLHLLEQDPNEGLRRALPLAGLARRRGTAPPSGSLGRRDPNFRLGTLAGGRAADAWDVPPDLQSRLRERYRQLANEEIRLGRHRRAAYIHAELLGDLFSAAACLKQGEHYHEAAILYRDHLARPLEAADCFAAGGEYSVAIVLYEQGKRYLQVAAMHEAMGDEASAAAAYRHEVDRLVLAGDQLAAADLLETKLAAPDEATRVLREGWMGGSPQAGRCLEKLFERFGARGLHGQAAGLVADLAAEHLAPTRALPLTRHLATAQETYPDEAVRHAVRDLARVTVAGRLPAAELSEVRNLVDVLGRLAPDDRLLLRDGSRYLAKRQEQEKRRPPTSPTQEKLPVPATSRRTVRKAGSFQMPVGVRWQQFRSVGSSFYAAGYDSRARQMKAARIAWNGSNQTVVWPKIAPETTMNGSCPLLLEVSRDGGGFILCAFAADTGPALAPRRFPVADRPGWDHAIECGQPTWWPGTVLAATFADGNFWLLRAGGDGDGLLLACHARHGGIVSQVLLPLPAAVLAAFEYQSPEFCLASVGNCLFVGCSDRLLLKQGESDWKELAFESRVTGLVPTPALARVGCAVQLESGAALVWPDRLTSEQTVFTDLANPLVAFTRQGTVVVVSRESRRGQLFEIIRGEARAASDFDGGGDKPVALLATDEREAFAIVDENGSVHLYAG